MRWSSVGIRTAAIAAVAVTGAGLAIAPASAESQHVGNGVSYMKPFNASDAAKGSRGHGGGGGGGGGTGPGANLYYHGGVGGIGVETAPVVYLVIWGSQWGTQGTDTSGYPTFTNDASHEAARLVQFFKGVGGSSWLNSVTQYCQGLAAGTVTCGSSGTHATNPSTGLYGGMYFDNTAAPSRPSQSQLAAEAVKAANFFGAPVNLATQQFVIATSHGNNASGFGTQYCAWHSSTLTNNGYLAYTNLPYITDAGGSCGADFVNSSASGGATDGITIVEGHEMAESITDQFPNGGWLDTNGEENGDKCAWISSGSAASQNISLSTGSFAVQTLWSNAANSGAGGCVVSY